MGIQVGQNSIGGSRWGWGNKLGGPHSVMGSANRVRGRKTPEPREGLVPQFSAYCPSLGAPEFRRYRCGTKTTRSILGGTTRMLVKGRPMEPSSSPAGMSNPISLSMSDLQKYLD